MEKTWQLALLNWYRENKRDLPWRKTRDPYAIWVSEIMLQQTRVDTVIPYYERFLALFPNIKALASAPIEKVYKAWEGLGYYSRARNLQRGAQAVLEQFGGAMPREAALLQKIPGIGEYTAGAISSIAFDQPACAVDGNVMRVGARLYGDGQDIALPATKKYWQKEALGWIPQGQAGDFNQSLMELGALVCLPRGAKCAACPVRQWCRAFVTGQVEALPVKSAKAKPKVERYRVLALVDEKKRVLFYRRPEGGLLGGLWLLPMLAQGEDTESYIVSLGLTAIERLPLGKARHVFTHLVWEMEGELIYVRGGGSLPQGGAWVEKGGWQALALPGAQAKLVRALEEALC
ncbi:MULTISPECIES: A/G-specific adenine glycosylase [unclassified Clostridium]|uniref:A/G-specific adenine glycosylase n=1 Tax=unclassified Clostridium TaxID=2614128 RepID=UPI0011073E70|nr:MULTISPECIES: A/G-specific adenine glycosylase [unclassified Clostridium]